MDKYDMRHSVLYGGQHIRVWKTCKNLLWATFINMLPLLFSSLSLRRFPFKFIVSAVLSVPAFPLVFPILKPLIPLIESRADLDVKGLRGQADTHSPQCCADAV